MEQYKVSEIEFDVLYADGTKKHVKKGILFEEASDHTIHLHIGTDNQLNMFRAIAEALLEIADNAESSMLS